MIIENKYPDMNDHRLDLIDLPGLIIDNSGLVIDVSPSLRGLFTGSNTVNRNIYSIFNLNTDQPVNHICSGFRLQTVDKTLNLEVAENIPLGSGLFSIRFRSYFSGIDDFSSIFNSLVHSDIAMCTTDSNFIIQSCNEKFINYMQSSVGQRLKCNEFSPLDLEHELNKNHFVRSEGFCKPVDQKEVFFIFSVSRIFHDIDKYGYFFYFIDISHRKNFERKLTESEQMMKAILSVSPLGIAFIKNRKILWANDALYSMLEYEEDLRGVIKKMIHYPDKIVSESTARDLLPLINEITYGQFETKLLKKDDSILECMIFTYIVDMNDPDKGRILTIMDINDLKKAEHQIQAARDKLRELTRYIENARESERKEIAREIHDELGHVFTVLKIELSLMKSIFSDESETMKSINSMIGLIDDTIPKVRAISTRLRPSIIDHFGLEAAIEWQTDEFVKRTGIKCNKHIDKTGIVFDSEKSISIFRIFQESLTNLARHSGADTIEVFLRNDGTEFVLITKDNGIGMDSNLIKNNMTLGITGMRERARMIGGRIEIVSEIGIGTEIILKIPLKSLDLKDA